MLVKIKIKEKFKSDKNILKEKKMANNKQNF